MINASPSRINSVFILAALILFHQQSAEAFSLSMSSAPPKKWYGGAGIGRLTLDEKAGVENAWKCKYDMVLVERIQGKAKKESGLFIPDDDLPRLHLAKGEM